MILYDKLAFPLQIEIVFFTVIGFDEKSISILAPTVSRFALFAFDAIPSKRFVFGKLPSNAPEEAVV